MLAGKQHTQLQHPKLLNSIVAHWSTSLSFFFTRPPQVYHITMFMYLTEGIKHLSHTFPS